MCYYEIRQMRGIVAGVTSGRANTMCFNNPTRWELAGGGGHGGAVVGWGISVIGLSGGIPCRGTTGNLSSGSYDDSKTIKAPFLGVGTGWVAPSNTSIWAIGIAISHHSNASIFLLVAIWTCLPEVWCSWRWEIHRKLTISVVVWVWMSLRWKLEKVRCGAMSSS